MRITRRKKLFVAGIAAVGLIGGSAFAFWTQGGGGAGQATVGNTSVITVKQTSTPSGLRPGGPAQTLSGVFLNPLSNGPVTISAVTATVRTFSTSVGNGKPECTQDDFTIGGSAAGSIVPAGAGDVGSWTGLTIAMDNDALNNQDNCKDVVIDIDYVAVP